MPRPLELRRAAQLMIRRHGTGAAVKAGFRAACLIDTGDTGAATIWIHIIAEINRIRAEERSAYVALPIDSPIADCALDHRVA